MLLVLFSLLLLLLLLLFILIWHCCGLCITSQCLWFSMMSRGSQKKVLWAPSSKFSFMKVLGDLRCSRAPLLQPGLCTVMRHRESRSRCRMALFGTWYLDSGRWAGYLPLSIPRKNPVTYDTCLWDLWSSRHVMIIPGSQQVRVPSQCVPQQCGSCC